MSQRLHLRTALSMGTSVLQSARAAISLPRRLKTCGRKAARPSFCCHRCFVLPFHQVLFTSIEFKNVTVYQYLPAGNTQEIRSIYEFYGSLDISDYDLRTPLHVAVSLGKLDMVTFLLSLNVPTSPVDRWGVTPLWSALCEGKKEIAQVLRSRGGEIKQSYQAVIVISSVNCYNFFSNLLFQGCFFFVLSCRQPIHCSAASSSS
jgi:ankyrin repeat protein